MADRLNEPERKITDLSETPGTERAGKSDQTGKSDRDDTPDSSGQVRQAQPGDAGQIKLSSGRLTSKEIARLCGVSRGTVDRALHGKPGINAATRSRILQVAEEMGYRPDYLGQSLVKGRTRTIGVVVFDLKNYYFTQLLQALEVEARSQGYAVLISLSEKSVQLEQDALQNLRDRRVDGIILQPVGFGPAYEQFLKSLNLPVVTVGNHLSDQWDHIGFDNRQAASDAVAFLARQGYRCVIYAAPPLRKAGIVNVTAQEERLAGFLAGIEACGMEGVVIKGSQYVHDVFSRLSRQRAAATYSDGPKPQEDVRSAGSSAACRTAVLCSSDWYALQLLKASRADDWRIPQDFGLMGFDRLDLFDLVSPSISSVVHPIDAIGRTAVRQMLERLSGTTRQTEHPDEHVRTGHPGQTGHKDGPSAGSGAAGKTIWLPYRIEPGEST